MDIQYYGGNCISLQNKGTRIVVDDNLDELGKKNITKNEDVALYTSTEPKHIAHLEFSSPGEYEVADISIVGIPSRSHMDEENKTSATMFKISLGETNILITGHIYPKLSDAQLEQIGIVDIMIVPVGGNGYTVDPVGALNLIKQIEPKIIVPTHYAENDLKYPVPQKTLTEALTELSLEPKETVSKYRVKPAELSDITQLIILSRS